MEIEYGYCHCGCGNRTTPAKQSKKNENIKKGDLNKYIKQHHKRLSPVEYIINEKGCWVWQRSTFQGYGVTVINGKSKQAHRLYYQNKYGEIPKGFVLDHLCRNRSCVNIEHLELVTYAVNIQRGFRTKLNPTTVREIRLLKGTLSNAKIGRLYNVTGSTVAHLLKGKTWKNIN